MIQIEERISKKVPGRTSLFITFPYNTEILEAIKSCDCCFFDKNEKEWEIPCSELTKFIIKASTFDSIDISFLEDKDVKKKPVTIDVNSFKSKPYDYQLEGIKYGLEHDRWLLLDAPGLGKTLQILYIAQELYKEGKISHCLIICGVNTLKTNWKKEIKKHTDLSCRVLGERLRKNGNTYFGGIQDRLDDLKSSISEFFVITNIETLRDKNIIKNLKKGKNSFDMIVLDEAHCCKNPSAQQTANFLKLCNSKYRIAATGTILTNSPLDAFIPLKWIGVENCSYTNFKYYYQQYGGPFGNDVVGYRHTDVLKDELSSVSLRRTKDLLNLPPKTIIDEIVDMSINQSEFYKNVESGVVSQVDKVNISNSSVLSCLTRLRQATACPSILTTEEVGSAKIDRCVDLVEQMVSGGEKVVVYSTFKETLNVLEKRLSSYSPMLCTGDVKDSDISKNIDAFQSDDNIKVMLATWSKIGTGVTLTAASNAIFIDCAWTRALNEQAEDRIYRIGSKKPVFVYYLWANDTVDLKVKELVEDKSLMSEYIMDDKISSKLMDRLKKIIVDLQEV